MELLVFAIIVLLAAILLIMLVDALPGSEKVEPFARILILLVALIVIAERAGAF